MPELDSINMILDHIRADVDSCLDQVQWAEEEIAAAQRRHPGHADTLFHSFALLKSFLPRMGHELLFRAHCREILDRLVAGRATQGGTAAEVLSATMAASLAAPLGMAVFGLHLRMWRAAGLPPLDPESGNDAHYEAINASRIDGLEALARRKLARADRVFADVRCGGLHWGERVSCRYVPNRAEQVA